MKTYDNIKMFNFFTINGGLGTSVSFEKIQPTDTGNALCISSSNGTYQKGTIYFIQSEQIVKSYE